MVTTMNRNQQEHQQRTTKMSYASTAQPSYRNVARGHASYTQQQQQVNKSDHHNNSNNGPNRKRRNSTNRRRSGNRNNDDAAQREHQSAAAASLSSSKRKKKKSSSKKGRVQQEAEVPVECKPYRHWCPLLIQSAPWWMAAPPESSIRIVEQMRHDSKVAKAEAEASLMGVPPSPTRGRSQSQPPSSSAPIWGTDAINIPSSSSSSSSSSAPLTSTYMSLSPPARLQSPVAAAVAATAPERIAPKMRGVRPNGTSIPSAPWGNPKEDEADEVRAAFFEGMTVRISAPVAEAATSSASSDSLTQCADIEMRPRANSNPPKPKPGGKFKTKLCWHWESFRQCPFGPGCSFAHGLHELMKAEPVAQQSLP